MTNDNPKSNCCGARMLISNGGTAFFYRCEKCLMPCEPKPLPSEPKCEQCGGDGETWDGKEPRVRLCKKCYGTGSKPDTDKEYINLYPKKKEWEFTTVTPVEPTAQQKLDKDIVDSLTVEPSVESIARSIRKNFAVGQRLDSFALACLEDQILIALRNERNRK